MGKYEKVDIRLQQETATMGYFGPIAIIIAGFYLALRVSPIGALLTGLAAGVALGFFTYLEPGYPNATFTTVWVSPILGTVPVYFLANRYDNIKQLLMIVPLGALLILAGGPINCVHMWISDESKRQPAQPAAAASPSVDKQKVDGQ